MLYIYVYIYDVHGRYMSELMLDINSFFAREPNEKAGFGRPWRAIRKDRSQPLCIASFQRSSSCTTWCLKVRMPPGGPADHCRSCRRKMTWQWSAESDEEEDIGHVWKCEEPHFKWTSVDEFPN